MDGVSSPIKHTLQVISLGEGIGWVNSAEAFPTHISRERAAGDHDRHHFIQQRLSRVSKSSIQHESVIVAAKEKV